MAKLAKVLIRFIGVLMFRGELVLMIDTTLHHPRATARSGSADLTDRSSRRRLSALGHKPTFVIVRVVSLADAC
jgi:hypothetical protein